MSWVTDHKVKSQSALIWIPEHAPRDGEFNVWWTHEDPLEGASLVDNGCYKRWQMFFKDGQRADGHSYGWFPNGQLRQIISWKNGVMHGPNVRFHYTGYLNDQEHYVNGKREGVFFSRDLDGTILSVSEWKNGDCIYTGEGPDIMVRSHYLKRLKKNGSTD